MNSFNHDAFSEIQSYIKTKITTLSTWQMIKLILILGLIAGSLFGFIIGSLYTINNTNNRLYQISNEPNNIIIINNELFEISQINAVCSKLLSESGYSCTITNQRTNTTSIIVI